MPKTIATETHRTESFGPQLFARSFPLEDVRILSRAQGAEYADGRTVEAFVAVFDREAEIHDGQGDYMETIDRRAFNRAIEHSRPQGTRHAWRTGVFYNHGLTIHGTPSEKFSMPLGSPIEIRADAKGLLTVTRYNQNQLADEVLELYRSGNINGHSFTGKIIHSDPEPSGRRGYQRLKNGSLPKVRRTELGLSEYGPTPFPAYVDANLVGIRSLLAQWPALLSSTPDELDESDPDEPTPVEDPDGGDTSTDVEPVPDDPPAEGHSSRDSDLARIAVTQKIALARRTRPGLTRQEGQP